MARYRIRTINSEFESADEGEFDSLEAAKKSAIITASEIVGEAIAEGHPTSAVELQIFEGDQLVARQVVALSVTDLTTGE
jgi:hypothetical protein